MASLTDEQLVVFCLLYISKTMIIMIKLRQPLVSVVISKQLKLQKMCILKLSSTVESRYKVY